MQKELTVEQQATNHSTWTHIHNVSVFLLRAIQMLQQRMLTHDRSKLYSPEVETFTEFTPKLKTAAYGSKEYQSFLDAMKPALANHYQENAHHPEHHSRGIDGMTLVDLLEMLADWRASSMRSPDGNIYKSIEFNAGRFGIDKQLKQILLNSVALLEGRESDHSEPAILADHSPSCGREELHLRRLGYPNVVAVRLGSKAELAIRNMLSSEDTAFDASDMVITPVSTDRAVAVPVLVATAEAIGSVMALFYARRFQNPSDVAQHVRWNDFEFYRPPHSTVWDCVRDN